MEQIFQVIGYDGPYQKYLFIINLLTSVLPCVYSIQVAFLTKHPSFIVKILQGEDAGKIFEMDFKEELCDSTLYEITKNPLKSVINWSYTYDLYCDRDYYNVILSSVPFFGSMLGTLFLLPLPDKYGRKPVFKISMLISLFFHLNLLCAFGPIHLIIITFLGGIINALFAISFALFTEFFQKEKNGILIGLFNAFYPFFGIFLAFFFMISKSWRYLYLITFISHSFYTYYIYKYFIESPRWLHSKGFKEECIEALTELAIFNGTEKQWYEFKNKNADLISKLGTPYLDKKENEENINDKINNNSNNIEMKNKNYTIFEILGFKSQRTVFIKVTIIIACSSYIYFGIILNLGKMKGNFFLNGIFAFLGELSSELVVGELADRFGRITIFKYCFGIGIFGFVSYLICADYLKFLFIYISILGFTGFWNIMTIYSPEIFPTKIRNITFSYSSFTGRVTPMFVPILTKIMPGIIDYTFLFAGIISGLIGITLEETLGKKIMDIIPEEIEEYRKNIKMELLES